MQDDALMERIYLDYQATTPCDRRVVDVMLPFFTEAFGNPASDHEFGRTASLAIDQARAQVAALIGATPQEIIFTSGATEANNLAIKGAVRHQRRTGNPARRVITLATEHKCVLEAVRDLAHEGLEPVILEVGPDGLLDPERLRAALATPTLLVSIMAANNETGVLQDLATLAPMVRAAGALMHSDCAQAAGRISLAVGEPALDMASLSAHKLYGPKGVGALYVRRRPRVRLDPLLSGGGQERGLRSGTLPTALIAGFGAACAIAAQAGIAEDQRAQVLLGRFLERLRRVIPGIIVNGSVTHRLGANLNLQLPDTRALDVMAQAPELAVSTGSACSAAELVPSYVLTAMGLDADQASRSLRLAVGRFTSARDMDRAAEILSRAIQAARGV